MASGGTPPTSGPVGGHIAAEKSSSRVLVASDPGDGPLVTQLFSALVIMAVVNTLAMPLVLRPLVAPGRGASRRP